MNIAPSSLVMVEILTATFPSYATISFFGHEKCSIMLVPNNLVVVYFILLYFTKYGTFEYIFSAVGYASSVWQNIASAMQNLIAYQNFVSERQKWFSSINLFFNTVHAYRMYSQNRVWIFMLNYQKWGKQMGFLEIIFNNYFSLWTSQMCLFST